MKKKCTNKKIAFAVLAGLSAAVAQGYTVSSEATVTVTDENKSEIEQGGSISLADATSTIIYSTSTAPGVPISGAGTILKTGASDWTLTVNNSNFTGTYAFSGGTTTFTDILQLGKNVSSMHVFSTNGATLCALDNAGSKIMFSSRTLHIEGTGVNNAGAFTLGCKNNSNAQLMGKLVLEGDALMVLDHQMYHRGKISLNGHTLTKDGGSGIEWFLQSGGTDGTGNIVVNKGIVRIAEDWSSSPNEMQAGPITFKSGTSFYFRNTTPIQYRPMRIEGNVSAGNNTQYATYTGGFTTAKRHQAGPVVLADGAKLTFAGDKSDLMNTFSGPISGGGEIVLSSSHRGRFYLANPTNSFTGTLSCYGHYDPWPDITVAYSNSIPDYSKFSVENMRVRLEMHDDDSTWRPDAVARLLSQMRNTATTDYGSGVSVCTTNCTDETYLFDFGRVQNPVIAPVASFQRLYHEGNGTLSLTGAADLRKLPVGSMGGTLNFTGTDRMLLGEVFAFAKPEQLMPDEGAVAVVSFNGAKDVVFTNSLIRIGSAGGTTGTKMHGGIGRVTVTNSTLTTSVAGQDATSWNALGGFVPGCYGTGVLEVAAGSLITNRLYAGVSGNSRFAKSVGAVLQSGGDFTIIGSQDATALWGCSAIGAVSGSHGYYQLDGGCVTIKGFAGVARESCPGIFMQHGGTLLVTNAMNNANDGSLNIALTGAAKGVFYMDGGKAIVNSLNCARSADAGATSVVTIDGADTQFLQYGGYLCCNYSTSGKTSATFNFNGGVFSVEFFSNRYGTKEQSNYVTAPGFHFNFNGGTLRLIGTSKNQNNRRDPFIGYDGRPPAQSVQVFEDGATLDLADCDAGSSVPFVAPPGKGVSAIDWTADGYAAPPYVVIDGDGTNATAIALYDSSTRRVTGVKITSHGWGYTEATAYFISGTVTNGSAVCTLADNVSGSFTKKGPHTLTLYATNTWGGATILAEGSLKCGVDHAIPASSTIVLAGGTLNMNGKTLSDDSAMPKNWAVDRGAAIAAGTPITYDGDLSFPEGSTLSAIGGDVDSTTPSATLLVVTGTVSGSPTLVDAAESPRHRLHWSGNKLRYTRLNGTYISFR